MVAVGGTDVDEGVLVGEILVFVEVGVAVFVTSKEGVMVGSSVWVGVEVSETSSVGVDVDVGVGDPSSDVSGVVDGVDPGSIESAEVEVGVGVGDPANAWVISTPEGEVGVDVDSGCGDDLGSGRSSTVF